MSGGFTSSQTKALRHRTLDLHNTLRRKLGTSSAGPLSLDSRLNQTAQAWAEQQAKNNRMSHGDYYTKVFCTKKNGSYSCSKAVGENVAGGYDKADDAVGGWRRSCQHFYNMINPGFKIMGVGAAKARNGTVYWAVHFAGPSTVCSGGGFCCKCVGSGCGSFASNDPRRP